MKTFTVIFTPVAKADINNLRRYIIEELGIPMTADRYVEGIYNAIQKLSYFADSFAISQQEYIQNRYGPAARTINFKKMTIVYNIIGNLVLIRRVMASKLIQ
jgi:plasmid stabilization system protein ParE